MKTILTKKEELWDKGKKIYDDFASGFGFKYSTPSTNSLEMFALLKDKKEEELLLREIILEYIGNLPEEEIMNRNGCVYLVDKKLTKL